MVGCEFGGREAFLNGSLAVFNGGEEFTASPWGVWQGADKAVATFHWIVEYPTDKIAVLLDSAIFLRCIVGHILNSLSDYTLNLHLSGVCLKDIMITIQ